MNCPVCQLALDTSPNKIVKYYCPTYHYMFFSDYCQEIFTFGEIRVSFIKKDFYSDEKFMTILLYHEPTKAFRQIMTKLNPIPFKDEKSFVNKIKTMLVFS